MTGNIIEIFVEDTCSTCSRVIEDVSIFVRGTDTAVRIFRREGDSEKFRERNVVICPATFVNGRLSFYGEVSPEALKKQLYGTQLSQTTFHSTSKEGTGSVKTSLGKSAIAGLLATFAMTVIMLMAPLMGMPEMNIGRMLGGFMGVPSFVGWAGHFMIGVVLAVAYGQFFAARLPGAPWVRGILYGLIPWLMSQVIINPMMGAGVFASLTPAPALMVMGSLLGHMVYGAVLGPVYARRGTV
jgi:uncharacterized membrane protein YagU involved in acid resistance